MFEGLKKRLGMNTAIVEGSNVRTTDTTQVQRFLRGGDVEATGEDTRLLSAYKQSIAVFRSINIVGTSLAQIPYILKDGKRKLQRGPVMDLYSQPNDQMTWFEFLEMVVAHLHMSGNAFIYIDDPNSQGVPRALMPIPPSMISPVRGVTLYKVVKWKMKTPHGREPVYFNTDQIIHLQYAPDPDDPIIGVGPLEAARITVESDYAAALYNKAMLKSGGLPAGLLRYEGPGRLNEEMKEEVSDSWRRTYGGVRSGRRVAVVNKEWTWQQMSASARDMEFGDARKWDLKDIARAMNVPLMYLNEIDATGLGEAGISLYRRLFYEQNIIPLSKKIETALNNSLWAVISKRLRGGFDFSNVEALREDYNKKVEAGEKLYKIGFSINAINKRLELGLDEMAWGDDWFVPVNMVPAIDVLNHTVQLPIGSGKDGNQSQDNTTITTKEIMNENATVHTHKTIVSAISSRCIGKVRKRMMKIRSSIMSEVLSEDPEIEKDEFDLSNYFRQFIIEAFCVGGGEYIKAEEYADTRVSHLSKYDKGLFVIFSSRSTSVEETKRVLNKVMAQIDEICKVEVARAFNFSRLTAYRKIGVTKVRLIGGCSHEGEIDISNGDYPECGCVVAPAKE